MSYSNRNLICLVIRFDCAYGKFEDLFIVLTVQNMSFTICAPLGNAFVSILSWWPLPKPMATNKNVALFCRLSAGAHVGTIERRILSPMEISMLTEQ